MSSFRALLALRTASVNIITFNKPNQGAGCTHSLPHCQKTHISLYHGLAISSNVLTGTLLKIRACEIIISFQGSLKREMRKKSSDKGYMEQ